MSEWYLSFADETGFLGACIVPAEDMIGAVTMAHVLGCNPGGEVAGAPVPADAPMDHWPRGEVLSRERIAALDAE
jgi:hypothetical protein